MSHESLSRRELLQILAGAGLVAFTPRSSEASASSVAPYDGPLFILVHAGGGWDPTSLCDPKGVASKDEDKPINSFLKSEVKSVGPFQVGPVPGAVEFFQTHQKRLIVLNGIDTSTNGHDSGTRHMWSGNLVEGYPSIAAMVAATFAPKQPLAFLSGGGYDYTAGHIAPTRVGNVSALQRLTKPNAISMSDSKRIYHESWVWDRIVKLRNKRLQRRVAHKGLPASMQAMAMLRDARLGVDILDKLLEKMPAKLDASNNPLKKQSEIAAAAFAAGLGASASLSLGGFDTHANHDATHRPRLTMLLEGVSHLYKQLEAQKIADRAIIVVGSDFGRTPGFNAGNGKDHWSITSAMVLGPTTGKYAIKGGRVIGATTDGHHPLEVNPKTLAVVEAGKGERITPGAIHLALRAHLGLSGGELDKRYVIKAPAMPLLKGA